MSPSDRESKSLLATQQWMLSAITAPSGLAEGLERARQLFGGEAADIVATPPGVSLESRLNIYARGYWLRLLACLRADYPALQRLLGDPLFEFFARAYLNQHPPQSYSLNDLGAGFPAFLRRSQRAAPQAARVGALRFACDLARLEHARAIASRSAGSERRHVDAPDPIRLMIDDDHMVEIPDTTRLLTTRFPVGAFRPWLIGESSDRSPASSTSFVVVARSNFRVTVVSLTNWQFYLLAHARHQPRPLQACLQAAARRTTLSAGELRASAAFWLPSAQTAGLVIVSQ